MEKPTCVTFHRVWARFTSWFKCENPACRRTALIQRFRFGWGFNFRLYMVEIENQSDKQRVEHLREENEVCFGEIESQPAVDSRPRLLIHGRFPICAGSSFWFTPDFDLSRIFFWFTPDFDLRRVKFPAVGVRSEERWDGGEGRSLRSSRIEGRSRSREEGARRLEICWSIARKEKLWIRPRRKRRGARRWRRRSVRREEELGAGE